MTTELAVQPQGKELANQQVSVGVPTITYTRDQLDLIKRTYATDATDDELALFVYASKRLSLDILARQIHFTKRAGKTVFIVSIDGYRLNAERTGCYAPGREPTFAYDDKKAVMSATAYVKKFIMGEWHETAATAFMSEYKPDEKSDWMWKKMPHNQLAKCAEALALRRAFPKDLGDTVTEDEMAQVREPQAPIKGPELKQQPKSEATKSEPKSDTGDVITFIPAARSTKSDKNGKDRWAVKHEDGTWFSTYSKEAGSIAVEAGENKVAVTIAYTKHGDFYNIESAKLAEKQEA